MIHSGGTWRNRDKQASFPRRGFTNRENNNAKQNQLRYIHFVCLWTIKHAKVFHRSSSDHGRIIISVVSGSLVRGSQIK